MNDLSVSSISPPSLAGVSDGGDFLHHNPRACNVARAFEHLALSVILSVFYRALARSSSPVSSEHNQKFRQDESSRLL